MPYLRFAVLLATAAFAQDRFVAVEASVVRVSGDNALTRVVRGNEVESDLRYGSSAPRVSPDQRWIAYIENENARLRPTRMGKAIQLTTAGKNGTSDICR